MQTTRTKDAQGVHWHGNYLIGSIIIVLVLMTVGALTAIVATQAIDDDTPGNSQSAPTLKPYHLREVGEGVLGTTAIDSWPKAHYVPEAGEGLLGGTTAVDSSPKADFVPEADRGLLDSLLGGIAAIDSRMKAYYVPEAGEGLLGGTTAVDSRPKSFQVPEAGKGRSGAAHLGERSQTSSLDADAYLRSYFPGFAQPDAEPLTYEQMLFMEMNTQLPGAVDTATREPQSILNPTMTFQQIRFLEMNQLPEDTIPTPPDVSKRRHIGFTHR